MTHETSRSRLSRAPRLRGLAVLPAVFLAGCGTFAIQPELPPHALFRDDIFKLGDVIKCGKPEGCTPPVEINRTLVLIDVGTEPLSKPHRLWCDVKPDRSQPRTQAQCVRVYWGTER